MMNPEVKKKWLKRLRKVGSRGKARGTFRHPKDPSRMCCLGHLCELYRQETGKGTWRPVIGLITEFFVDDSDRGCGFSLPDAVARWAGLPMEQEDLARANDSQPGFPIELIKKL